MIYYTHNLKETYELAGRFVANNLLKNYRLQKRATVVGLYGELGAGKTSFTQGVARAFKIKDYITSPTFVLEKIYKLTRGLGFERLVHIDVYRLNGGHEMKALGWDEILADPKNIIFIEWPEKIADALPRDMIKIYFSHGHDENLRKINIEC